MLCLGVMEGRIFSANDFAAEFKRQCAKTGSIFGKVDRWRPSTKMCSGCGQLHDMPLDKRTMKCDYGLLLGRDTNAAINIKNAGMSAFGLGTVSRDNSARAA